MINIADYQYSKFIILNFFLLSLLLFVALKIIKLLLPRILKKHLVNFDIIKHYSSFELVTWLTFLFWSLPYFYRQNIYYAQGLTLIIFFIILWIGWYGIRDIVSGFIARNNPAIRVGNKIIINQDIITVIKHNATQLEGRLENGNIIFIKYNKLLNSDLQQLVEHEITHNKTIELSVPKSDNPDEITRAINSFLLTRPDYAIKHLPEINKLSQTENQINFRITIYALDAEHIIDIEESLRKKFENIKM